MLFPTDWLVLSATLVSLYSFLHLSAYFSEGKYVMDFEVAGTAVSLISKEKYYFFHVDSYYETKSYLYDKHFYYEV